MRSGDPVAPRCTNGALSPIRQEWQLRHEQGATLQDRTYAAALHRRAPKRANPLPSTEPRFAKRSTRRSGRSSSTTEFPWHLTNELRGRAQAPDWSRGRTLSPRARGDTTDSHGPLQRLLERMLGITIACVDHRRRQHFLVTVPADREELLVPFGFHRNGIELARNRVKRRTCTQKTNLNLISTRPKVCRLRAVGTSKCDGVASPTERSLKSGGKLDITTAFGTRDAHAL